MKVQGLGTLLGFSRPKFRLTLETILIVALGIALALLFNKSSGPTWAVRAISVEYTQNPQQLISKIDTIYNGGCRSVLLEQWIINESTGEFISTFNYTGPPRVKTGFQGVVTDITALKNPLEPGYWLFEMSAVCTVWNGSQQHFRLPTTRFLVKGKRRIT